MKIYFAGSIRGGRDDRAIYASIIEILQQKGVVLTEHLEIETRDGDGEEENKTIFERDSEWLDEADMIIAEVTQPSLGVGYAIARAECMNKPVMCLYRRVPDRNISPTILGNDHITIHAYTNVGDIEPLVEAFLAQ